MSQGACTFWSVNMIYFPLRAGPFVILFSFLDSCIGCLPAYSGRLDSTHTLSPEEQCCVLSLKWDRPTALSGWPKIRHSREKAQGTCTFRSGSTVFVFALLRLHLLLYRHGHPVVDHTLLLKMFFFFVLVTMIHLLSFVY